MNPAAMRRALGPLFPAYQDPEIREIRIDAPDRVYFVRATGSVRSDVRFPSRDAVASLVQRLFALVGRTPESLRTTADARLADGTRVTVVLPPVAVEGPVVLVRKMASRPLDWDDLGSAFRPGRPGRTALERVLETAGGVLVAGDMGAGKTSVAGLLADALAAELSVVTVERDVGLSLRRERLVRLEASPTVPMAGLVKVAASLRPDWLVVDDLLGAEAMAVLEVMRTGVAVLATTPARGVLDALRRLELLALAADLGLGLPEIRAMVAAAVRHVVHCERSPGGVPWIVEVAELAGLECDRYRLRAQLWLDGGARGRTTKARRPRPDEGGRSRPA